jgi:hypothetical protein
MPWKIIIHFKDEGTHDVDTVDALESAIETIQKIFEGGLSIQTETRYAYYPPEELKMAEAIK